MSTIKLVAATAIPLVLYIFSSLNNSDRVTYITPLEEGENYLEIPDYIFSIEYKLAVEKTYMETFDKIINADMQSENMSWLGYCHEKSSQDCAPDVRTMKRCGDKISWGGEVFCLAW